MTTLYGFTRPADPIVESGLEAKILLDTGFTVTATINPTTIDVIGALITSSNTTAIQNSINGYVYSNPIGDPSKLNVTAMTSNMPISTSTLTLPSSYAVNKADTAIRRKAWTTSGLMNDLTPYLAHATTNSSGVATIYLTDNGLSTGNAVFSAVNTDGLIATAVGSASNYQVASVVLSGDLKSVAITVNQLGSVVLGLVNVTSAAAGVEVKCIAMGVYAG